MADAIVNHDLLNRRLYKLSVTLISNGIREDVPSMSLANLSIEKDFRGNLFPILNLQMVLSSSLHKLLMEHRNDVKVQLVLTSYLRKSRVSDDIVESSKLIHINELFQPVISDISDDTMEDMRDITINDSKSPSFFVDLYLFKTKAMEINKAITNFVAKDCKVKDAIGYVFKQTGVDKVLMMNPDNNEVFPQLIVPPMNLKNAIQSISDNYGIYKNGSRQFYDFDCYYLLANRVDNVPTINGEYNNVYVNVTKMSSPGSAIEGFYTDDKNKCYVINNINSINVTSMGSLTKETNGNVVKSYSRTELESAVSYNPDANKFSFGKGYTETNLDINGYGKKNKVSYTVNRTETSSTVNEYATQAHLSNVEFTMSFNTIDLDMFKMNRVFIFRFEDNKYSSQYNGRYIIESLIYVMSQQLGEIQALCKFRKVD